ncbi:HEPN domain-containing protein [Treponema endosymbiont of Eucomonympha sp.]|uniref:HEPN domain-containing protein n=1 Tax=Treponema endosymbiont of Eucomonympha sp. TaxID=1580831 RepID=UPI000783AF73|nr:HEPN domain-containing protein [Treponema endosymbiont of Eucomonympha sp.]
MNHLISSVQTLPDEQLKSKYAGFLCTNAVTVYELAIKDIFIEFAEKKNQILGNFVERYFDRINGQIMLNDIKKYVKLFGEKYLEKFNSKMEKKNKTIVKMCHNDIRAAYGNLITCRHKFIHSNNQTLTFNEVVEYYKIGKEIIHVLNETMKR